MGIAAMICPKCGYQQQEGLDCQKCGVVFSKYHALYPSGMSLAFNNTIDPDAQDSPEATPAVEIVELRQQIRELSRKSTEAEFERAQRNQLRINLKNVEQRLGENLLRITDRLDQFERQWNHSSIAQSQKEMIEAHLAPLLMRLDQIEGKIEGLSKDTGSKIDPRILEILRKFEQRLVEAETKATKLLDEHSNKRPMEGVPNLDRVMHELDELRSSLQNVTVRYTEIGDLKKNHLVLLSAIESLQQDLASRRKESATVTAGKVPELEMEILALRAEVRQILERMGAIEATPSGQLQEVSALKGELEGFRKLMVKFESGLNDRILTQSKADKGLNLISQQIKDLEDHFEKEREGIKESSQKIAGLESLITPLREEAGQIRGDLGAVQKKLEELASQLPEEPRTPLEDDVHAMRQSLDKLHLFITALGKMP